MMSQLTNEERLMISQIAADLESGNHLLRPRSNEYCKFMREVCAALDAENKTHRQFQITQAYHEQFYGGNDREN